MPRPDPANEAVRDALVALLVVLSVMVTDPTLPTPWPAPTLWQPEALAPMSAPPDALILPGGQAVEGLPDLVLRAGPQAAERTIEFFTAQIRNPHTRAAYGAAVTRFVTWCDARRGTNGGSLLGVSPGGRSSVVDDLRSAV